MGRNLVEAAQAAGVAQFVHSSVSGAGDYVRHAPGWQEQRWDMHYWESKAYTEDLVRRAGFAYWTLLKPAFFMDNFTRPSFLLGSHYIKNGKQQYAHLTAKSELICLTKSVIQAGMSW